MSRTIIFAVVMLAAALVTFPAVSDSPARSSITNEVLVFDAETTSLAVNYKCFKKTLETTLDELESREVDLAGATARVYSAANTFCPIYLERVVVSDKAPTVELSIAQNLVGHLRSLEEVRPALGTRVAELDVELEKVVNQMDNGNVR